MTLGGTGFLIAAAGQAIAAAAMFNAARKAGEPRQRDRLRISTALFAAAAVVFFALSFNFSR